MQGFYNSTDGTIHVPNITKPIEDDVARAMRHAYMAAVSWMDQQLGRVLDELERLGLAENTVVLLHGEADVTTCLALVGTGVSGGGGEGNVCLVCGETVDAHQWSLEVGERRERAVVFTGPHHELHLLELISQRVPYCR